MLKRTMHPTFIYIHFFETKEKEHTKNRLPLEGFLRASPTRGKKERKGKN